MLYFLIHNKPILIRSMLAAGIVQDTFAGEAGEGKGGEEETTGGYCYIVLFLPLRLESLPFLRALEFHTENTHTRTCIRNRRSRDSIDMTK